VQSWQRAWEHVTPFFVFPPEIRRVVYTTNAIESLNMQLRKIIKTRDTPQRRGRHQAAPARAAQCAGEVRAGNFRMEISHEPVCYPVWRAVYARLRLEIFKPPSTQNCGQVRPARSTAL
jgi:hypothetical protein